MRSNRRLGAIGLIPSRSQRWHRLARPRRLSRGRLKSRYSAGVSVTECLIVLPLLLVLGLGAWQWILILQARQLIEHAAYEAVRSGAVGHASVASIDEGLAHGLAAYWSIGTGRPGSGRREVAVDRVAEARREGVLEWRQLAPTRASFHDWAEPARDPKGRPIDDLLEIPIDNLDARIARTRPSSGVAGWLGAEPIGQSSGQTLRDASVLRIEVQVALPLRVPVAGWMIAGVARAVGACADPCLVAQVATGSQSSAALPHLPVRVHAEIRMQSPVRPSARTPDRRQVLSAAASGSDSRRPSSSDPPPSAAQGVSNRSWTALEPTDPRVEPKLVAVPVRGTESDGPRDPASPPAGPPSEATFVHEGEIWAPGACGINPG